MNVARLANRVSNSPRSSYPIVSSRFMKLTNLPQTVTPADLRRLCAKNRIENTESFALDYNRFKPTGTAFITFTKPDFTPNALKILHNNTIGGSRIQAELVREYDLRNASMGRTRGGRGKAEAAERGLFDGMGPHAGLTRNGCNVVINGLPGKSTVEIIGLYLRPYKMAGHEEKGDIVKVDLLRSKMAVTSSFVVRLATASEAHRLVRNLHMTFYRPDLFMEKYPLRAHVIY